MIFVVFVVFVVQDSLLFLQSTPPPVSSLVSSAISLISVVQASRFSSYPASRTASTIATMFSTGVFICTLWMLLKMNPPLSPKI